MLFLAFQTGKDDLILHFYCTITSNWSTRSDNGWYSCLKEHPDFILKHFYCSIWELLILEVAFFLRFSNRQRPHTPFLLCNGWYSCLKEHRDYILSCFQAFLLWHFGDVKSQSCLTHLFCDRKAQLYCIYWDIKSQSCPKCLFCDSWLKEYNDEILSFMHFLL